MINAASPSQSLTIRLLSILLVHCLAVVGFSAPRRAAVRVQPNSKQPSAIQFDEPRPSVEPNKSVTIRAMVLNKSNVEITGAQVTWAPPPTEAARFISLSTPLHNNSGRLLTITGLTAPDDSPKQVLIPLTAKSGNASTTIYVEYKATATVAAARSSVSSGKITFTPAKLTLTRGDIENVKANVLDKDKKVVKDAIVEWEIPDEDLKKFVRLGAVINNADEKSTDVFGLEGDPKITSTTFVPIIARAGGAAGTLIVQYEPDKTAKGAGVTISISSSPDGQATVAPGTSLNLTAVVKDDKKAPVPDAEVRWSVPESMSEFVTLTPSITDPNIVTVTGRFSSSDRRKPPIIPVLATYGDKVEVKDINYLAAIEPQVDVSWDVLPQEIVSDNFGRSIKKEYYCIEVVIGNNSGGDLQLAGLGFELPEIERAKNGKDDVTTFAVLREAVLDSNGNTVYKNLKNNDGTDRYKVAGVVPVTSYATVRGSLAKRKLSHPRALTLAGISAFGQLLGGFNPFFFNPNHGKNFANGVNIISNPLAKGVELVWQDPYPGELERLDQQTLRDDKIIPNSTTFKTRVFFPKDALFNHGDIGRDDIREVRRRLGTLLLVGHVIERKGFINRLRFGSTQTAP